MRIIVGDYINGFSFNRNIVECKYSKSADHPGKHLGFNRNIVECKSKTWSVVPDTCGVLIETLWNVNHGMICACWKIYFVLIETLWNVNYLIPNSIHQVLRVLIETLWNVNFFEVSGLKSQAHVLIETLWNVNVPRSRGIHKKISF